MAARDTLPPMESKATPTPAQKAPQAEQPDPTLREHRQAMAPGEENRLDRSMEDRAVTESRELDLNDEARMEVFRSAFVQAALPGLPTIPGWHMCWVSTTNDRDTIPLRMAMGYQLVRADEIPGWRGGEIVSPKSGEYAGMLTHNELVAMKVPQHLYERYMEEAHHNQPNNEAMKLVYQAKTLAQQAEERGARLIEGDGLEEIKRESSNRRFKLAS